MPVPPCDVWTRKEWQQQRNSRKVPKGFYKKASIGDLLEKFHKARGAKKLGELAKTANELEGIVRTYTVLLEREAKPGHQGFAKAIRSDLLPTIEAYRDRARDTALAAKAYKDAYTKMALQVQALGRDLVAYEKAQKASAGKLSAADRAEFKVANPKGLAEALGKYAAALDEGLWGSAKLDRGVAATFRRWAAEARRGRWTPEAAAKLLEDAKRVPGSLELA